jgi:hypothetical protein
VKFFRVKDEEVKDEEAHMLLKHAAELHGVPARKVLDDVINDRDEDDESEEEERRSGKTPLILTVVSVLIFGAGVWYLTTIISEPAVAGQTNLEQAKKDVEPKEPAPNHFSGLKFQFDYPHEYDQVARLSTDKKAAEQYAITSSENHRRTIMVNLRELPSGKLTDNVAAYELRAKRPDEYTMVQDEIQGTPAVLFIKKDRSEQTLMWPYKGMVVTIAMTFTGGSNELTNTMTRVMTTMRWRE